MTSNLSQEQLCQQLVSEARDAIIFADREGIIRLWNRGAAEIFDHPEKTALGQSLDFIIPEPLRERHNQAYQRVMASGQTNYGRELLAVPGLRQDGTRISLEFTITLIKDNQGRALGAAAIIREVTSRWQQEQERQKRLADLEARLASLAPSEA